MCWHDYCFHRCMDTVKDQSGISLYLVSVVHQLPRGQQSGRRLQDQIRSDVPMSTWKLGHQRTQSFSQCMKFTGYCLRINWTHSLPSMPLLDVTMCDPTTDLTLILLALGRALSQKISWHHQKHSFVRSMVCLILIHATKVGKSKVILQRSSPRYSATNHRCCKVPYHVCTLSSNYMESSSSATPQSSSSGGNGMDDQGRPVSATATLSATYVQSLQGVHFMWVYKVVPQPKLQLQVYMNNTL